MTQKINTEPVLTVAVFSPIVVFLLARFGLQVDTETAASIATAVLVVGGWFARQRVTPTGK